ncbi:hypothetical protein LUR56_38110 [Streptomyces sp. MT29]|nr:hypothetical protein [Streptomyces sp. MT29]
MTGLLVMAATVVAIAYLALEGTTGRDRAGLLKALATVIRALAEVVRAFFGKA